MVHGRLADRALKYEAGVFEVDAASRLWTAGAVRTLAGRVTIAPLADGDSRGSEALEISAALLRTDLPEGRGGPTGHLVMGDTFFRPMFVNGAAHPDRRQRGVERQARVGARRADPRRWTPASARRSTAAISRSLVSTGGYVAGLWHLAARDGHRYGHAPLRALDLTARFDRLSFGSSRAPARRS